MAWYWFGGAPGVRAIDGYLVDATGARVEGATATVADAATGVVLTDLLDDAGNPVTSIVSGPLGYVTFAATVPIVDVTSGSEVFRMVSSTALVDAVSVAANPDASMLTTGTLADARLPITAQAATLNTFYAPIGEPLAVKLTGDQTIAGVKNFTSIPTVNGVPVALTAPPVVIGTAPTWYSSVVGPGVVGEYYTFTYVATGTAPISYVVTGAGILPPGLSLNATTGVLSGTPLTAGSYTFTVTASNGVTPDPADPEQNGRERTIVITGTPVTPGSTTTYGPAIGFDTKSNIQINGTQKGAFKFKAASTSLTSVRFTQRSGPGSYSEGNFGTMTIQIRPDDGAGHPHASTVLATLSFVPSGSNSVATEVMDIKTFVAPATLTVGTVYWLVFTGGTSTDYLSVNASYTFNAVVPRQPRFPDAEFGALVTSGAWGALNANYTPTVDYFYADGTIGGQPYYSAMILHWRTISGGAAMVREQFTVSGGGRTVTGAYARVRRGTGTSPLVLNLDTINASTGAWISTITSVSVPATNVPISSPGGDNGGSVWVGGQFAAAQTLTNGASYALRLSTASGTTYTMHPLRDGLNGTPVFSSAAFADGTGQYTTNGSTWVQMYEFDSVDAQCYFTLA